MARRRTGFQKKIDTVHWTLIQEAAVALSAGTVAFLASAAQHLPETLLRIRGEWAVALNGAPADASAVIVTAGLIQVPEGTGTTVLWSPNTDGDAPWIWWDAMHLIYQEATTDVMHSTMVASGRRIVDSKAMRKIRNTELQFVVENVTVAGLGSAPIDCAITARVLSGS